MEKYTETSTPILDIVLVDDEGRRLPPPVMTVIVDERTRVVSRLTISIGNHGGVLEILKNQSD